MDFIKFSALFLRGLRVKVSVFFLVMVENQTIICHSEGSKEMYFSKIEQTTILEVQERRGNYEGICTSRIQRKISRKYDAGV